MKWVWALAVGLLAVVHLARAGWANEDSSVELRLHPRSIRDVDEFIAPITRIGDVDGDGLDDLAVVQTWGIWIGPGPEDRECRRVISLISSSTLEETCRIDPAPSAMTALAGAGDLDGDGICDLAIGLGSTRADPVSRIVVVSTRTGQRLRDFPLAPFGSVGSFGFTTSPRDGRRRLLVPSRYPLPLGRPGADTGGGWNLRPSLGRIEVVQLETGEPGVELWGPEWYGEIAGWLDDIDGDGITDFATLGQSLSDFPTHHSAGSFTVEAISGATGELLWRVGSEWQPLAGGRTLRNLGDIDGDGISDLGLGITKWTATMWGNGRIAILSGRDGGVVRIHEITGKPACLGEALADLPDIDGDGTADYALHSRFDSDPTWQNKENRPGEITICSGRTGQELTRCPLPDKADLREATMVAIPLADDRGLIAVSGNRAVHFYDLRRTPNR